MKRQLLDAVMLALVYGGCSESVVTDSRRGFSLGYEPTINKKISKRLKRKAEKRRNAPAAEVKQHNQRNKKGRP